MAEDALTEDQLFDAGVAFSDAGDEANAEPLFARAAEMGSVAARYNQGNALHRLGRLVESARALGLAVGAGDGDAPLNLGQVLHELGDLAGAEAAYRQAAQVQDPRGNAALGYFLWAAVDATRGEEVLRAAVAEGDAYAARQLAWLLEDKGCTADVEELFQFAATVDENVLSDLDRHLHRIGRLDDAEFVLREQVARGDVDAMIALALLLEEDRGDLPGAERVLRVAVKRGEVHAYTNLALLLEERGAHLQADQLVAQGARAGDSLARRQRRRHRSQYKRQLNRAWRKRLRTSASDAVQIVVYQ